MLTSTYTLVALSVEQTTVRAALQSLLDELHALPGDFTTLAANRAGQLCGVLRQVYDNCHWRKLDKFLLPALRRSTALADDLLRDLERLSAEAAEAMAAAEACVGACSDACNGAHGAGGNQCTVPREAFCTAVEQCVAALRLRLEREEKELFPLARTAVGGDAWFAIANQMLAHDAYAQERRAAPRRRHHEASGDEIAISQARFEHDLLQAPLQSPLQADLGRPDFGRRHALLSTAH